MPSTPTLLTPSSLSSSPKETFAPAPLAPLVSVGPSSKHASTSSLTLDTALPPTKAPKSEGAGELTMLAGLQSPTGRTESKSSFYTHASEAWSDTNSTVRPESAPRKRADSVRRASMSSAFDHAADEKSIASPNASSLSSTHQADSTHADSTRYLEATLLLRNNTKLARKAMPMVMQSAGFGLVIAAAIHNPLLLLLTPALLFCGALLAAPAGWALAKFFQARAARKPEVQQALQTLDTLRAQDNFEAVRALAHQRVKDRTTEGGSDAFEPRLSGKKLDRAEAFARGERIFESGLRRSITGPWKYWKREFNETLKASSDAFAKTRLGAKPKSVATPVETPIATPVAIPVATQSAEGSEEKAPANDDGRDTKA